MNKTIFNGFLGEEAAVRAILKEPNFPRDKIIKLKGADTLLNLAIQNGTIKNLLN